MLTGPLWFRTLSPTCDAWSQGDGNAPLLYRLSRDSGIIASPLIQALPGQVMDTAPQTRLDCDVLETEGEQRLRSAVDEIMKGSAAY